MKGFPYCLQRVTFKELTQFFRSMVVTLRQVEHSRKYSLCFEGNLIIIGRDKIEFWHNESSLMKLFLKKTLLITEKRSTIFNFRHKNSGQCFAYMKHRPLIYLFINRLSTHFYDFLPALTVIGFYQNSTEFFQFYDFSSLTILRCFSAFYHEKWRNLLIWKILVIKNDLRW